MFIRFLPAGVVSACILPTGIVYAQQDLSLAIQQDQEFNELLMLLDAFPEFETVTEIQPPELSPRESQDDDVEWMLTLLEMLDDEAERGKAQSESELRSALMSLRRAEANSEGEIKATLSAAAENIGVLMLVIEQRSATTDKNVRFAIAEAQRAMALYHCGEAGKEASGSLADSLAMVSKRLEHLSIGARLMMSAAQSVNYRVPEPTKRAVASSVAMTKLFEPNEVPLSQIRTRARDIAVALRELGTAIKRRR